MDPKLNVSDDNTTRFVIVSNQKEYVKDAHCLLVRLEGIRHFYTYTVFIFHWTKNNLLIQSVRDRVLTVPV